MKPPYSTQLILSIINNKSLYYLNEKSSFCNSSALLSPLSNIAQSFGKIRVKIQKNVSMIVRVTVNIPFINSQFLL